MTDRLKLEVLLAAIDKVTGPFKSVQKTTTELGKTYKAAKDQLKQLQTQLADVRAHKAADKAAAITANAFKGAQDRIQALKEQMAKVPEPTAKMVRALKDAEAEADNLKNRYTSLVSKQQALFEKMKAGGVDVKNLGRQMFDLSVQENEAAAKVKRLADEFEKQRQKMARLVAARKDFDKSMAQASKVRGIGQTVMGTGAVLGLPAAKAVKDYAEFEDAMLGVARQVNDAKDANGNLTATYYEIRTAIKDLSERIPLATNEIARILEGGARMGIQGKENLLLYTELTAVMAQAFDLPVDSVGENIGKISQLYKIPMKDIKALGDTINWLDDNALSKAGDIIEVMQRIAGSATMVRMAYKDAAALGSTFLSLGARSDVSATATNALIGQLSNAPMLATAKRYRGGLEMLGLDAKSLQSGMLKDATGTILKVLEAIKALPQEKQLEATTRLFGKEYGDDISKLAQNLDEYRRQLELVAQERAKGSMQREADTRNATVNARLQEAKNALFNLSSEVGEKLKPMLVDTLEKTLSIANGLRAWARENPGLASGIMTVVKWLAIGVTTIGALIFAAGAILVPLAAMKFSMATLGIGGLSLIKAIKMIGSAFGWLGRLLLGNPIGIAITLIAFAAYLIYDNWKPIKAFFIDLWEGIAKVFNGAVVWVKDIGSRIVDGLMEGITAKWEALKSLARDLGNALPDWLKEKLGIRSPSRVFMEIGGYAMAGLAKGILGAQDSPAGALRTTARNMAIAGAGLAIAGGAAASGPAPGSAAAPMVVQITINPAPGMDEAALARLVAEEIRKIDAQRSANARSRLRDKD